MFKTDTILTERESQVVFGYVNGDNGKEIADKYCMAYRTVVNHTQNAFNKAGCARSVHALVSWWYRINFPEIAKKIGATVIALAICLSSVFGLEIQRAYRTPRRNYKQECVFKRAA